MARVCADAVGLFRRQSLSPAQAQRLVRVFCGVFPLLSLGLFVFVRAPARMVLWSGVSQALMLPVLGGAALYFRYCTHEAELRPGRLFDCGLWLSSLAFLGLGAWTAFTHLTNL